MRAFQRAVRRSSKILHTLKAMKGMKTLAAMDAWALGTCADIAEILGATCNSAYLPRETHSDGSCETVRAMPRTR